MIKADNLTDEQWALAENNRDLIEPIVRRQCRGHDAAAWSEGYDGLVDAATQYDPTRGPFNRYARRIIRRRVVAFRKDKTKRKAVGLDTAPEPVAAPYIFDPSADVHGMIQRLSGSMRRAMELRYIDGASLQTIADQMEISLSMVSRYVKSGVERLKELFAQGGSS